MKKFQKAVLVLLFSVLAVYGVADASHSGSHSSGYSRRSSSGSVHVRGYTRKNGTYVQPHYRSRPNSSKSDNWSTKGNVNPYTGKAGTKNPQ